jgi:hypothetical protein
MILFLYMASYGTRESSLLRFSGLRDILKAINFIALFAASFIHLFMQKVLSIHHELVTTYLLSHLAMLSFTLVSTTSANGELTTVKLIVLGTLH